MTQLAEIQNLVLASLEKSEDQERGLASLLDDCHRSSNGAVLTALAEARDNIDDAEHVFHAALLYYNNDFAWDTRAARSQKGEALRLLLLWFDFHSGTASKEDLDRYLWFLETRMEIRFFADDARRAIAYIESIYGEKTEQFLADITFSQASTVKRWRSGGSNPTKSSKQVLASTAEVLYQLHEIKGWDEVRTIAWFEKNAFAELTTSSRYTVFTVALENRLKALGLVPVGMDLWY